MAKNDTPSSDPTELKARTTEELIDAAGNNEGDAAIEAIEKNKNLILGVLFIAIVAFATVLIVKQMAQAAHIEAAEAYSAAADEGTVEALDAVASEYDGSIAGGNALLMKSQLLLDGGKAQDSQTTLENFVSKYPDHPRHQQGVFALGSIKHDSGDLEGARGLYEQALATDKDSAIAPLVRIRIADTWLESGDSEKARQLYEEIPGDYPGSPFIARVEQKLDLARIGDIEVVPAPEPEPEPAPVPAPSVTPTVGDSGEVAEPDTKPAVVPVKATESSDPAAPSSANKPKAKAKGKGKNANPAGKGSAKAKGKAKAKAGATPETPSE